MQTTIFIHLEETTSVEVAGSIARLESAHGYNGWSETDSVSLGVSRGGEAGESPELAELSIEKQPDKASVHLMRLAQEQDLFKLTIHICTTADGQLEPYQVYVAERCRLQTYSIALTESSEPKETVTIHYEKLSSSFAELSAGNKILADRPPSDTVVETADSGA